MKQTNQRELKNEMIIHLRNLASKTQQTAIAPDMTSEYLREGMMCIMSLKRKKKKPKQHFYLCDGALSTCSSGLDASQHRILADIISRQLQITLFFLDDPGTTDLRAINDNSCCRAVRRKMCLNINRQLQHFAPTQRWREWLQWSRHQDAKLTSALLTIIPLI